MMNLIQNTAGFTMHIVSEYVKEGDHVIDATCGNGYDTLALARMVGETGKVYGFEIQPLAVMGAMSMLERENAPAEIELIYHGHELMDRFVDEKVSAVVFNLGYLPGGEDKTVTTMTKTTLKALELAAGMIKKDGIIAVTMYPGHEEVKKERDAVLSWACSLDKSIYHAAHIKMVNQSDGAPEILAVTRKQTV